MLSTVELDDPSGAYSKIGNTIDALLLEGKYAVLDASIARMRSTGKTLSDGRWAHDAVSDFLGRVDTESQRGVFSDLMQLFRPSLAEAPWLSRLELLRAWRDACPKSVAPAVCIAELYLRYAWAARGGGWAHEVADGAWKKFHTRSRLAADSLRAVDARAEECLAWFPIALLAIKAQGVVLASGTPPLSAVFGLVPPIGTCTRMGLIFTLSAGRDHESNLPISSNEPLTFRMSRAAEASRRELSGHYLKVMAKTLSKSSLIKIGA